MGLTKRRLRGALLAGAALAATCTGAQAQQVYSFGDSLSDTGNVNNLTLGIAAGGDYFDGRFSNGYLWTDYLSWRSTGELQRLNAGLIGPYFTRTSKPYNFAHGGALSGRPSSDVDTGLLSGLGFLSNFAAFRVVDQAKHFRDQSFFGRTFRSSRYDYATISAGGNDYFAGETDFTRVVNNIFQAIDYIDDGGIRYFFLLDVPNVGDTPANILTSDRFALNALSQAHNSLLRDRALSYEAANPGSILAVVPAARLFELVRQDALFNGGGVYGFTNVQPGAGTTGNCLGDGLKLSACPRGYLFYDDIHPTSPAHAIVADLAIATFNAKLYGYAEPLARSASSKQVSTTSSRVVTSRVQALKLGLTGSGQLIDPFQSASFAGQNGGLGFQTLPGVELGASKLSVFSFSEGSWSDLLAAGRQLDAARQMVPRSLSLAPGEAIFTMGADYLVGETMAMGAAMTRGSFSRQRLTTDSYDETQSLTLYGTMFHGPMTYTLSATNTVTDQESRRQTGFVYQPVVTSSSRSSMREVVVEADYTKAFGPVELHGIARVASTELDLEAFDESGSQGLLDRSVGDRTIQGFSAYAGIRAETALPEKLGLGRFTLEAGPVAGTSDELGYASVVGDALLFGVVPDAVNLRNPFGNAERMGVFGSASLELMTSETMTFAARAAAVDTAARTDHVVEVNLAWRF
ncbi:SGNH/GDSL hydrolase family protein [Parvularcula lutaonensis]|uniref:SGNH/GDSL hydrolase family protein n=1 Tax=Parvularcula lutaonensis TaxID=491923 RepID=A0ABV7MEW4_9PROT|nr:SGNH/GDSL hydrolase family protein [Parvularcula lutaonensis]GGY50815.1 hypothetical protein GCM10007148_19540 [Parvularcula lutaonensis]